MGMDLIASPPHFSQAERLAREQIQAFLDSAIGVGVPLEHLPIEYPPQPTLGDFAVPCFTLAQAQKKSPAAVAGELARRPLATGRNQLLAAVQAVGPYLNFFVNPTAYGREVLEQIAREGADYGAVAFGQGSTVLVEYFSPNTNKPLTIGHLRNVFLGWSLAQILRALGFAVVENSIYNDRGIAVCKSIVAYQRWGQGQTPESAGIKPDHFAGQWYVRFGSEAERDPGLEAEAQACLRRWEAGDPATRSVWRQLVDWAMAGFTQTLHRVGLDHPAVRYFESDLYQHGREVVEQGVARGFFLRHREGYVYAPLEDFGLPDKILLRSDGTTLYVTQDLYLAQLKAQHQPTLSLYVVASEQDLAFRQLFKILELLGERYRTYHVSYGLIRLPHGRIKSREGLAAGTGADELMDELDGLAAAAVRQRHPELLAAAVAARARAIALGALKYYVLQVSAPTTMVFDPKQSLAFTGKTGPYLQYVCARCVGILGKATLAERGDDYTRLVLDDTFERPVVTQLGRFPRVLHEAAARYDPSVLAHYLYDLAQAFSIFYQELPVLPAEPRRRASRLQLVGAVHTVMARGMQLLGIPVLEQM